MRSTFVTLFALMMVVCSAMGQDQTARDASDVVEITAPGEWNVQRRVGSITASMPTTGAVFTPTVSITVERLDGARKRLDNYVNMFYAEQHGHEHTPSDWSMRDTTFLGLKGKVIEYTLPYAGEELRTQLVVSIEGDKAYTLRMMWLVATTEADRATVRRVAATVQRVGP